jgi:hypothetical protein
MADANHMEILKKGRDSWNQWRIENPDIKPDLSNVMLRNATLREMDLSEANLRNTDLYQADLAHADLYGADFYNARLASANLEAANLMKAHLRHANLRKANLKQADFTRANLKNAILEDADLSGAILRDADLSCASLKNADLTQADMKNAYTFNTDITSSEVTEKTTEKVTLSDFRRLSLRMGGEEGGPLTIASLSEQILPYLKAISDLQRIINAVNDIPPAEVRVYAIVEDERVDVTLGGAERLIDVIQEVIVPRRQRRAEKIDQLAQSIAYAIQGKAYAESRNFKAAIEMKQAEIDELTAQQENLNEALYGEVERLMAEKLLKAKRATTETRAAFSREARPLIEFLAESDLAD